jgi:hypothetical protein
MQGPGAEVGIKVIYKSAVQPGEQRIPLSPHGCSPHSDHMSLGLYRMCLFSHSELPRKTSLETLALIPRRSFAQHIRVPVVRDDKCGKRVYCLQCLTGMLDYLHHFI